MRRSSSAGATLFGGGGVGGVEAVRGDVGSGGHDGEFAPPPPLNALVGHPQGFGLGSRSERLRELVARAYVELAVDVAQMPLDGLDGHELALRDLAVRQ